MGKRPPTLVHERPICVQNPGMVALFPPVFGRHAVFLFSTCARRAIFTSTGSLSCGRASCSGRRRRGCARCEADARRADSIPADSRHRGEHRNGIRPVVEPAPDRARTWGERSGSPRCLFERNANRRLVNGNQRIPLGLIHGRGYPSVSHSLDFRENRCGIHFKVLYGSEADFRFYPIL